MSNRTYMQEFPEFGLECPVCEFKIGKDQTLTWQVGGVCEIRLYRISGNRFKFVVLPPNEGSAPDIIIPGQLAGTKQTGKLIIPAGAKI